MWIICNNNPLDRIFLIALSTGIFSEVNSKVDYIPLKGIEFDNCIINLN